MHSHEFAIDRSLLRRLRRPMSVAGRNAALSVGAELTHIAAAPLRVSHYRRAPDPPTAEGMERLKRTIVCWLVSGATYAAVKWRLLFLPALLLFFPGIFIDSALAVVATVLLIAGLAVPIADAIYYVILLQRWLPGSAG